MCRLNIILRQWFPLSDGLTELPYFYVPMQILLIVDIVLLTMTALKIRKTKKETAMLKHSDTDKLSDAKDQKR